MSLPTIVYLWTRENGNLKILLAAVGKSRITEKIGRFFKQQGKFLAVYKKMILEFYFTSCLKVKLKVLCMAIVYFLGSLSEVRLPHLRDRELKLIRLWTEALKGLWHESIKRGILISWCLKFHYEYLTSKQQGGNSKVKLPNKTVYFSKSKNSGCRCKALFENPITVVSKRAETVPLNKTVNS